MHKRQTKYRLAHSQHLFKRVINMLYEFKSRVAGTVVMTQAVGEAVLGLIGRQPAAQGIIVPEHIPAALEILKQAAAQSKTNAQEQDVEQEQDPHQRVSLAQRLVPFIELLERSLAANREVTWGV
jgi:cyclopropane-fatty-acyl-phospholipid synthase